MSCLAFASYVSYDSYNTCNWSIIILICIWSAFASLRHPETQKGFVPPFCKLTFCDQSCHFWNGQLQLRMVLDQVLWRSMQEVFEGIRLATCAPCQGQVHPQFETERGNLLRSPCKNWVNHVMMSINYKPRFMGVHRFCRGRKTAHFQKFSANCGWWTASYVILRQHIVCAWT